MAAWELINCLVGLRTEFNTLSPKRDKGADGSIGDSNHNSSSDHTPDEDSRVLRDHDGDSKNEVHALDIDSSGPWPGTGTQKQRFHRIVMRIIAGEKAKWKSDKDKCRLNYVIWDGHIYDKDADFEPRKYNGSDPHTNHAHYSGRYETACENDTRPWGVLTPVEPVKEDEVALGTDKFKLTKGAADALGSGYKEGQEVDGATALNLMLIWAARGGKGAADAAFASQAAKAAAVSSLDKLGSVDGRLGTVEDWISRIGDPSTDLAQVSQALKALWGAERARALGQMLQS